MAEHLHLFSLPSVAEYAEFMVAVFKVQAKAGKQCSGKLDDRAGYISYVSKTLGQVSKEEIAASS